MGKFPKYSFLLVFVASVNMQKKSIMFVDPSVADSVKDISIE